MCVCMYVCMYVFIYMYVRAYAYARAFRLKITKILNLTHVFRFEACDRHIRVAVHSDWKNKK